MSNPVIAEILRGPTVESVHRGAFAAVNTMGEVLASQGDIEKPVFPRSAIKAFQCLPVLQSGAADHFGFTSEDIALCCSSHNGEAEHVRVAHAMLKKINADEQVYECGAHWPTAREAAYQLVREGKDCSPVHNNCSGKHAGMLALAKYLKVPTEGYVTPTHAVQRAIAHAMGAICDCNLDVAPMGIDGCSVPTWAMPLKNTALGFARLTQLAEGKRIIEAAKAHPFLIAGSHRFDTKIMQAVPRLFIKVGAEGVFCGAIAHAEIGFALKCDDGALRGAEVAVAQMLSQLDVWTAQEADLLKSFAHESMHNWRKINVGESRASF